MHTQRGPMTPRIPTTVVTPYRTPDERCRISERTCSFAYWKYGNTKDAVSVQDDLTDDLHQFLSRDRGQRSEPDTTQGADRDRVAPSRERESRMTAQRAECSRRPRSLLDGAASPVPVPEMDSTDFDPSHAVHRFRSGIDRSARPRDVSARPGPRRRPPRSG